MSSVAPPRCAKPSVRSTFQPCSSTLLPVVLARGDHALGDHVHRLLELELLPLGAARAAVLHLRQAARLLDQLARGGALGAERALVDRRARVALDVHQLAVARVDHLAAAHGAVGADGLGGLRAPRSASPPRFVCSRDRRAGPCPSRPPCPTTGSLRRRAKWSGRSAIRADSTRDVGGLRHAAPGYRRGIDRGGAVATRTLRRSRRRASRRASPRPRMSWDKALVGGFLAGAYIAFGALLAITVTAGMNPEVWGTLPTFFAGAVFSLGLILVVIGGSELLTGNMALIPLAAFKRRVPLARPVRELRHRAGRQPDRVALRGLLPGRPDRRGHRRAAARAARRRSPRPRASRRPSGRSSCAPSAATGSCAWR